MSAPLMSAAEVAALRTALGLSQDHLARMLGVNVRTVRAWESGRHAMSESAAVAVRELVAVHTALVAEMLDADAVVSITRDAGEDALPPRGWYLAAAGRAMLTEPDLMVGWS